jgi:molecular chaperone HtpG
MSSNFNPKVGKHVLETLTTGMYDDARFIFREYIQNAADQIELAVEEKILKDRSNGKIEINIDDNKREIVIKDNATGIRSNDILEFLGDIADSQKDRDKRKGFRGIGRLGGLGYCEKLIFETSYKGEATRSLMILDAKMLNEIILDRNVREEASTVLSVVTTVEKENDDKESHYFKVTLQKVTNDKLLDIDKVIEYLSIVAPAPFHNDFKFSKEIIDYFSSNNIIFDEYNITVNDITIFKAYKNELTNEDNTISQLIGVDFFDIKNDNQEVLAYCWYGFRNLSNYVLSERNVERGFRIRMKNITIGDENTCSRFFNTPRTNLRFIGEIHTVSNSLIPNARRDYFVENQTCNTFDEKLTQVLESQNLENRIAQTASKLYNRKREIEKYRESFKEYEKNKKYFDSAAVETFHLNKLKELEKKAIKASKEIENIKVKSKIDMNINKLFNDIIGNFNTTVKSYFDTIEVSEYDPPEFKKLSEEQSKVMRDVFSIIEEVLDFNESEKLKKIIFEKYN